MSLSPPTSPGHVDRILREADCLYSPDEVACAYDRMAADITHALTKTPGPHGAPLILAVPMGGLFPAMALLSRFDFPLTVDCIHATRYQGDTTGKALDFLSYPRTSLQGREVIVIDDILDEGITLAGILDFCRSKGACRTLSAVLAEKRHDRRQGIRRADFTGLVVEDRYVFGCGMDYRGYLRNAPGIYAVKGL